MKKFCFISFLIFTLAAVLSFAPDAASAKTRTKAERPLPIMASTDVQEVAVDGEMGSDFVVTLTAPYLPGYSWQNYNSLPNGVSLVSSSTYVEPVTKPDVVPNFTETRTYRAAATGRNRMILMFSRPGDEAPLKYVIFKLNIKLN